MGVAVGDSLNIRKLQTLVRVPNNPLGESGLDRACTSRAPRSSQASSHFFIAPSKEAGLVVGRRPVAAKVADGAILTVHYQHTYTISELDVWDPSPLSSPFAVSPRATNLQLKRNPKSTHEFNSFLALALYGDMNISFKIYKSTFSLVRGKRP
jgi:hypothetical protein